MPTKEQLKEKIIKTDKGYFFDTDTGYYIKLSDEVCDLIDAPSSDFQEEGERWECIEDLLNEEGETLTPTQSSGEVEDLKMQERESEHRVTWECPRYGNGCDGGWGEEGEHCSRCGKKLIKREYSFPNEEDEGYNEAVKEINDKLETLKPYLQSHNAVIDEVLEVLQNPVDKEHWCRNVDFAISSIKKLKEDTNGK
jgi:hypothetical protein